MQSPKHAVDVSASKGAKMTTNITLREYANGRMIGMRSSALPIRSQIELALQRGEDVSIDFSGVEITQSFADELIGALILRKGAIVMNRLLLRGCSATTRGILQFVANDRASQAMKARHRSLVHANLAAMH